MLERRTNRLYGVIVFILLTFALVACSDSSSTSSEESELELSDDTYSGSESDNYSSGAVAKDSLGRPISSSGDSQNQSSGGSAGGNSSSSVGPVVGIEDTVITDTTVVTDVDALPECTAANEGESFMVQSENTLYFCLALSQIPTSLSK